MDKFLAKLTSKYQATIPLEVREYLRLKAKDQIVYEILEGNGVMIRKAAPLDIEYLRALNYTLNEWDSPEDDEAYKDL